MGGGGKGPLQIPPTSFGSALLFSPPLSFSPPPSILVTASAAAAAVTYSFRRHMGGDTMGMDIGTLHFSPPVVPRGGERKKAFRVEGGTQLTHETFPVQLFFSY